MKTELRKAETVPDSPALNRYAAHHVTGRLDVGALRSAWTAVIRSAASCAGTGTAAADGRPTPERAALRVRDVRDTPRPAAAAHRLGVRWAAEPFTGGEPCARLGVARTGDDTHLLVLTAHRCLDDETAFPALAAALSHGVAAAAAGRDPGRALPPWPCPEPADPWWAAPGPAPAGATLPAGRTTGTAPPGAGTAVPFDFGTALAVRAERLALSRGRSAQAVVLAAFTALLARYHGGESATRTFTALLADTERVGGRTRRLPLYDALFAHRPPAPAQPVLQGAGLRPVPLHNGLAAADLLLVLEHTAPSLTGRLEVRSSLYDARSARRLLGQLRTLLDAALALPDVPLAALPLENAARLRAAAHAADARGHGPYPGAPVHDLVAAHAPTGAPAVVADGHGTDYAALCARARTLSAALTAAGVTPGDAVAVRMPPGSLRIAALLAVMRAGATLLWLGTAAGERQQAVLDRLRPVCLLTEGPAPDALVTWYRDQPYGTVLDAAAPIRLPAAGGTLPSGGTTPAGQAPPPGETPSAPPRAMPPPGEAPPVAPEDLAYVAFTSGSTGAPKGIPQTHAALAQFAHWMGTAFAMGPGARVAQWVAPEHDPALAEICATLTAGGTLCPVPERVRVNPDKLVPWLAAERVTHLQTVPSFARDLLDVITALPAGRRPAALSHLLLMGEALPRRLALGFTAALPGIRLFNLYGPTETIAATWHEVTAPTAGPVPIGGPIPGRQVLVLDEDDRPCPAGVTGHLVVRSPYVTPGYLGGEGQDAFRPPAGTDDDGTDRWYRTGDLARRRLDGTLEFRGRRDFQVKLFGNRVELTEVEAALTAHDSVAECAVVARANAQGLVTRLAVYVVPRRGPDGSPLGDARQWRAQLRRRFGPLALPAAFTEVQGRLPRNAAGKVDRSRLV